jgi:hypothetical protein
MSGTARLFVRLTAGLSALLVTGFATLFGSAAYASQPGPDVVSDGFPALDPVGSTPLVSAPAPTDHIAWAMSALVGVLVVAALAVAITALYRRYQIGVRQLQLP